MFGNSGDNRLDGGGDARKLPGPLHDVVKSIRCVNNLTRAGEKMADQ
jgi:hypothetical protein